MVTSPTTFTVGERGKELLVTLPMYGNHMKSNAQSGSNLNANVNLRLDVTGRTDLFSREFEDRVSDVFEDALTTLMRGN